MDALRTRQGPGIFHVACATFDCALHRLEREKFRREHGAVDIVALGDINLAATELRLPPGSPLPVRLKVAAWLMEHGYEAVVDHSAQIIRWVRP